MDSHIIALIGISVFFIIIFLNLPLAICMILVGFLGIGFVQGFGPALSTIGVEFFRVANNYSFTVIPLFVVMGFLAGETTLAEDAFTVINKWIGHFKGGIAMAVTGACTFFSAICGDIVAIATTMTAVALPTMKKTGYRDTLSIGCIAAGGNLGFLIPPSVGFIIYALITEQSIGQLFIAGIFPGVLMATLFIITIIIWTRIQPNVAPPTAKAPWKERFKATPLLIGPVILIVVVLGGIYTGIFTPTEAASIGVIGVILIGLLRKQFTLQKFVGPFLQACIFGGRLFLLFTAAMIFSRFLALSELPQWLGDVIKASNLAPVVVLIIAMVFYFIAGLIMDIGSIILIVAPTLHPILVHIGYDPIFIAVLTTIMTLIGAISPPVGIVVFGIKAFLQDVPLWTIYRGALPFLAAMVICLILCMIFPQIALFLPQLMFNI